MSDYDSYIKDLPEHVGPPDEGDLLILEHAPDTEDQETRKILASELGGGGASDPVEDQIHAASGKSTPADADEFTGGDSEDSYSLFKITWAQIKTALSALFLAISNKASGSDITTGTDDDKYVTAKAIADAGGLGGSSDPVEDQIHAASGKSTPADADEFTGANSADSYNLFKTTWAQIKTALKTYFDAYYTGGSPTSGWIIEIDTWTYASASSFTVVGNITDKLWIGQPIRWKQGGGYKYGNIVSFSYSSPNTTITIAVNLDYTIANSEVTDIYLGVHSSPTNFPASFNIDITITWTAGTAPSGSPVKYQKMWFVGNKCYVNIYNYSYTAGATVTAGTFPLPVNAPGYGAALGMIAVGNTPNLTQGSYNATTARAFCTSVAATFFAWYGSWPIS